MLTQNRTKIREEAERRKQDRRQNDNEFNSPQWIELMKMSYVAWPKFDRRETSRRQSERRQDNVESTHSLNLLNYPDENSPSNLLSKEEKLFFDNLFKDAES